MGLRLILAALALALAGCPSATQHGPVEQAEAVQATVSANASRVAAHIEAAQAAVVTAVELTPAHRIIVDGNLSAAAAALPRPSQADRDFVAALKTAADYKRAAHEAEARALVQDKALSAANAAAAAEREGREQDRADADARIWRIAAVGLFVAGAVTAYVLKTYVRSSLLAASGAVCALVPSVVGRIDALPWWAVLLPVALAASWVAWRFYYAEPKKRFDRIM